MKIIELSGLDPKSGLQFFNTLNSILHLEGIADVFNWHDLYDPFNPSEHKFSKLINTLADIIKSSSKQNSILQIFAKSYGSYLAYEAVLELKNKDENAEIQLIIFAVPYRLGFPPNPDILNSTQTDFNDDLLAFNYCEKLSNLKVPVKIFHGENDDLGPITSLTKAAKQFSLIEVIPIPKSGHNLDPNSLKLLMHE